MSSFGANDLIFNSDMNSGIHTGGFSINSIMMKSGISPIMTINTDQHGGSNVSDLFTSDLVVPNWAYSYDTKIGGRSHKKYDSDDEDDDNIDDDLHDKLLDLVRVHDNELKKKNKKTKKNKNGKISKKGGTMKNK
jgi:hypothetical protein